MKADQYQIIGAAQPYYCCPECGELHPVYNMYRKGKRDICNDCVREELLKRAWKVFGKEYIGFKDLSSNK